MKLVQKKPLKARVFPPTTSATLNEPGAVFELLPQKAVAIELGVGMPYVNKLLTEVKLGTNDTRLDYVEPPFPFDGVKLRLVVRNEKYEQLLRERKERQKKG